MEVDPAVVEILGEAHLGAIDFQVEADPAVVEILG
jgi:hypothetical protein